MKRSRERRGVSEIVGVLLMLAIVAALGVLIFAFSSGAMSGLSQGYAVGYSQRQSATNQKFVVEQVSYTFPGTSVPALDGSGYSASTTTATSESATLTTTKAYDVIIVVTTTQDAAAYRTVSSVSATGLTFSQRGPTKEVDVNGYYTVMEEWYAIASSPLSGAPISVTYSAAPSHYYVLDVFGISGANIASPFDSNAALPSQTSTTAASITTSNADDFLFGFELCDVTGSPTQGTGWTGINVNNGDVFASEYQTVTTTQTALTVTWSNAASDANVMLGDAVVAASSGADVYVRNVGTVPTTLVSVYVTDTTSNTFVSQTTIATTVDVGSFADITHSIVAFTPSHGQVYQFTVTSSLGNAVVYSEEAN